MKPSKDQILPPSQWHLIFKSCSSGSTRANDTKMVLFTLKDTTITFRIELHNVFFLSTARSDS